MKSVGFVGWRGMVGSVLMKRMKEENDFSCFEPHFFSTSQAGEGSVDCGNGPQELKDAEDLNLLKEMDVILTCQGSDYTKKTAHRLRSLGWDGYWVDAASALRMDNDSIIALDPVNGAMISEGIDNGIKNFIGGNCTVSLMLMSLGGLFDAGVIEWVSSMTYQAASGAGAKNMRELLKQMQTVGDLVAPLNDDIGTSILDVDKKCLEVLQSPQLETSAFGVPLAGNLIPIIDSIMGNGQSREEWKGLNETNKILGLGQRKGGIPIDGTCVRVGVMRSHSQAFTIKLTKKMTMSEIETLIAGHNQWIKVIPNKQAETLSNLHPVKVSGTLDIAIGRLRKMSLGADNFITAFTVGDQLLWGAAEPLRRVLKIIINKTS